jgi:flagellar P-ring protein precursor FlgI
MRRDLRNERTIVTRSAILFVVLCVGVIGGGVRAARIKDITTVRGIRSNHLYGFGLVVGLAGTGGGSEFTGKVTRNMLESLQVGRDVPGLDADNVAAVMVTADLPPFARKGNKIDVVVSALDKSSSLRGGTLLLTPLKGADGKVYAVAQGNLSVVGFSFDAAAASVQQGHTTVGRIPGGAVVETEVHTDFITGRRITLCLNAPDFVTARRMVEVIEEKTDLGASVEDPGTVDVTFPGEGDRQDQMRRIAELQSLEVSPDQRAVVIINERTGTVVAGSEVGISQVAISHGNLTVITKEEPEVSQPPSFSESGETRTVPRSTIEVMEQPLAEGGLTVLKRSPTVSDVARALNVLGVSPRDIIAIFQALKQAGALHAELRIM